MGTFKPVSTGVSHPEPQLRAFSGVKVMSNDDASRLRKQLTPYLSELLGTFFFCTILSWATYAVALDGGHNAKPTPFIIGMGLAVSIYLTVNHSGGNLNPAVSFAFFLTG